MARLFISYSRTDEAFARRLAESFSALGVDVWIDVEDIPAGMKWSSAIQQGLNKAELMLVILSPTSMASTNVEDEWQYFIDKKKPIIPVRWLPADVHFQLNRLQYIDFHTQDFDAAFAQLVAELNRKGISIPPKPVEPQLKTPPPPKPPEPYDYFNRERAAQAAQMDESPVMPDAKKSTPPPAPELTPFYPSLSGNNEPNTDAASAPQVNTLRYALIGGVVLIALVALFLILPMLSGGNGGNPCPNLPDSQFKTGDALRIIGDAQTLFSTHDFDSASVATVPSNFRIVIFGSPVCGENSVWWPVTVGTLQGWMAENFNNQRLLQKWQG